MIRFLKTFFSSKPCDYYQLLGNEEGINSLVQSFYEYMETDPKAIDCLNVHELIDGKIPYPVKEKLFQFISGWLGGPNIFVQNHGPPRMRARHSHIKIGTIEKEQWIICMTNALKNHRPKIPNKHQKILLNSFTALAMRIQNQ